MDSIFPGSERSLVEAPGAELVLNVPVALNVPTTGAGAGEGGGPPASGTTGCSTDASGGV